MNLGGWELILIAAVALLLFGGRLPQVGRNMGRGIAEFKKGLKDVENEITSTDDTTTTKKA